jgi:hypothetical protein
MESIVAPDGAECKAEWRKKCGMRNAEWGVGSGEWGVEEGGGQPRVFGFDARMVDPWG